ncbi:MAG: family 20 glycosylhydrolase [Akkermansia sp.]|nr:family 20 glycosylhydrolase [Akkermansia sp.]
MNREFTCFLLLILTATAQAVVPGVQRDDAVELPKIAGAYTLAVKDEQCRVQAHDAAGAFYADQTLQQLRREHNGQLPEGLRVTDYPRYEWRGLHVDVSRHFFDMAVLRRMVNTMAALKLNRLHLHLTDGPGWRLEIKSYPRLTSVGAWRKKLGPGPHEWADFRIGPDFPEIYGGFYTQEQMREFIAYARERHVMVVPEIDLPGHAFATLVAYPHFRLPQFTLAETQCGRDILNVEHPEVIQFAKRVLDELMAIFPEDTPIHLGGDEVDTTLLSREQQRKFIQMLVDYLAAHGRRAITWDEAAENGVRGQWVMLWRPDKLQMALETGLPLILCPLSHFYFDYPQSESPGEPGAPNTFVISPQKVHSYTPPLAPQVLGIQANLWSEQIDSAERLFYMAFPRAAVMAEHAWGSPRRPLNNILLDWQQLLKRWPIAR